MSAAPALHAHVSLREGPLRERIHHAYRGVHGWQKLVVKLEHHLLEDLAVSAVVSSTRLGEERAAVALQLGIYDAEVRAVALAVIHLVVFARFADITNMSSPFTRSGKNTSKPWPNE